MPYPQAISIALVYQGLLRNLNFLNRPVRTRMPGGVGGVRRGKSRRPYPDVRVCVFPTTGVQRMIGAPKAIGPHVFTGGPIKQLSEESYLLLGSGFRTRGGARLD